ncbi:hypothetical protein SAMN06265365_10941 [Tistlia consotensis]|uniref:Uncharacterized protein n=1 Tax=Tistlia consotensis USBA 355 TaxID=560819 RepID=A0A1Y6CUJ2_9PROT|nr:hypothetical protein [Tistlia consotensis]SMF80478.1 hypothetical protein SAMN05428998_14141 [Tistlia consotensis USBA 355]SNR62780.1 hypothetical protein SAMN06265365_10941 [Tistlia consotensis]
MTIPTRPLALFAAALLATGLSAADAQACRGVTEYPQVLAALEASSLPQDRKAALEKQLEEGRALHEQAHRQNDKELMRRSLKILDSVKHAL